MLQRDLKPRSANHTRAAAGLRRRFCFNVVVGVYQFLCVCVYVLFANLIDYVLFACAVLARCYLHIVRRTVFSVRRLPRNASAQRVKPILLAANERKSCARFDLDGCGWMRNKVIIIIIDSNTSIGQHHSNYISRHGQASPRRRVILDSMASDQQSGAAGRCILYNIRA